MLRWRRWTRAAEERSMEQKVLAVNRDDIMAGDSEDRNENRTLWKLGTLTPGLITFYSTTKPVDKTWHVLGLGYNPSISKDEIDNVAVVHFNGNMKPISAILDQGLLPDSVNLLLNFIV